MIVYSEAASSPYEPAWLRGAAGWGWDPHRAGVGMSDGTISITTTTWLPGAGCRGVGLAEILHGSRDDPRVVWLERAPAPSSAIVQLPAASELPLTVLWPAGYRARFAPRLEIVDAGNKVVLREGDVISGACTEIPETNTLYLEPPFR